MKFAFCLCLFPSLLFAWTLNAPGLLGWQTKNLTVSWSSARCSISSDELARIIDAAIDVWNRVPTTNLKISRAASESSMTIAEFLNGDATPVPIILCDDQFGTNQSVDPDGVPGLTHLTTFTPIDYAGIILNSESGTGADIANFTESENVVILAHEIGHLLGLGHSGYEKALMYYSLDNKTTAVLTRDDRDGLTYIYPRNEFQGGLFGCAAVHRSTGSPAAWGYVAMLTLMLAFSFLARQLFFAFGKKTPV